MDKLYLFSRNTLQALKVSKTLIISILLVAFGQGAVSAPLIVNVGIGQTYTSLTEAGATGLFNAINTGTITGDIVATITSNITETGAVSLNEFAGSLKIQSDGTMRTLSGATTADNISLINIYGADNVTFDGGVGKMLTFKNSTRVASISIGPVIQFKYGSLNGTIKNCNIQSNSLSTSIGAITIGSGTNSVVISDCEIRDIPGAGIPITMIYSGSASLCSNTISILNNNIYNWKTFGVDFEKIANGCIISGNSFFMQTGILGIKPKYSQTAIYVHAGNSHTIKGNFIGGQSAFCLGGLWTNATTAITMLSKGIHLQGTTTSTVSIIEGNTIQNMMITGSGSLYGIHIDGSFVNVKKNKISFNIGASSSSAIIYGVSNNSSTLANEFSNNMIAIGGGNAFIYGFYDPYTDSQAVLYYNSIHIYGTESGGNFSYAFNRKGSAPYTLKNNILSNIRTGGTGKHYAIYSPLSTGFTSDYNDLYVIGADFGNYNGIDIATFADWKAISTTMDAHSVSIIPEFASDADLHILANTDLANIGTPVSVSDDIDGITRSTLNMGINQISTTPTSIWTGSVSADWNTPGNWISISKLVPTATDNVTIPNYTIKPVINQALDSPAVCNNLTIASGAVLTIAAGKALTLKILTNNNIAGTVGIIIKSDATGTGSLITNAASGTGSAEAQRWMTAGKWNIISSPLSGQTISGFLTSNVNIATTISGAIQRGMMDYDPTNNIWNPFFTNQTGGNLEAGKGFSMRVNGLSAGVNDAAVTFTGTLQAGTQSASGLSPGNWNCIGNPFTSSIGINNLSGSGSTNNFLTINAANLDDSYGAIYVWAQPDISNGVEGKYTTISNTPTDDAAFDVQQGQAFFVKMNASTTSVSFTPAMQFHNTVLALKSSNIAWPTIKLIASFKSQKSSTIIAFNSAMTKGLDPTYDAGLLKGGCDLLVYSRLVEDNGIPFAIQALPDNIFSSLIIPIGLDFMTGGEVVFSSELMNLPSDCKVILEDILTKTFTDLSINVYKTTIATNSVITDRFRLKTTSTTTGLDKETVAYKLTAYANRNIDIRVKGPVSKNTVATLYDIYGGVILVKKLKDGNMNIIPLPNIKIGIYMLSVNDNGRLNGFKILIRE